MKRALYRFLVSLHPRPFRDRFGPEMIEIFDHERKRGKAARLVLDGAASVLRQRFLRTPDPEPLASATGLPYSSGDPAFRTLDNRLPPPSAFASGTILSIVLLLGVGFFGGRGPTRLPEMTMGAKYSRATPVAVDRASIKEADPTTEVKIASPEPDPLDALARVYFEVVRLLKALDANRDRIISPWETVTAPSPLRRLDQNGDGLLDAEECGLSTLEGADPNVALRARREFMKVNPVLRVLDANGNGVISFLEIDQASTALRRLDKNGDGSLSPAEVLPERVDRRATIILSKLDKDRDRRLSRQEWPEEETASENGLLRDADRDHDGIVTEAELSRELTLRDEISMIEERAKRTMRPSGERGTPRPDNPQE